MEIEGDFVNGVLHRKGQYRFDGGQYNGEWIKGRYHGKGFLLFADGSSYTGDFADSVAHGNGKETAVDGTVRSGVWEYGNLLPFYDN